MLGRLHHGAIRFVKRGLVFKEQRITYAEFLRRIETTAGFLSARGIRPAGRR